MEPRIAPSGVVLEIEEFAVHDGPGMRIVVFLKGCPLRCTWCQNPESIALGPQTLFGKAVGVVTSVDNLAARLKRHEVVLQQSGGGVTFSGGEPLAQAEFVIQVSQAVKPMHVAVETSGQATPGVFRQLVDAMDLVMLDVKHTDPNVHKQFTGHDNRRILANLHQLCEGSTPFIVRVPLIPGVNDDAGNLSRTADLIAGAPSLLGVELLPYNTMAPAKYPRAGLIFRPDFDTEQSPCVDTGIFERRGIRCAVL